MPADFDDIQRKLILGLRTNITDPKNRVGDRTEYFSGDTIEVEFELQDDKVATPTGTKHLVKHINYIKVDAVTFSFITDYDYEVNGSDAGKITFVSAPATGTNNIEVNYGTADASWIYDDFPRVETKLTSFPRVAITQTGASTEVDGIGGQEFVSNLTISVTVFAPKKTEVRDIGQEIRAYVINNSKVLVNPDFIRPAGMSKMLVDPNRKDQIFQKTWDYRVPNICDLKV